MMGEALEKFLRQAKLGFEVASEERRRGQFG